MLSELRTRRSPPLKQRLWAGETTLGSWVTVAHPAIADVMAKAGFDWLMVDLEHSVMTLRDAEDLIRVIEANDVTPLVRVASHDPVQIKRVMDAGAHGVMVPMVTTRADAQRAVESVKYPPHGTRGVGLARAQGYGTAFESYRTWLERESIVIIQIEHIDAVERLADLVSVQGVDGFLVGPYDLSGSLGVPGQFDHPSVRDALEHIQHLVSRQTIAAGYHVVPPRPELVAEKMKEGYRLIGYSLDMLLLAQTCRTGLEHLAAVRSGLARRPRASRRTRGHSGVGA